MSGGNAPENVDAARLAAADDQFDIFSFMKSSAFANVDRPKAAAEHSANARAGLPRLMLLSVRFPGGLMGMIARFRLK